MRHIRTGRASIAVLMVAALATVANAEWRQTAGPVGGSTSVIASDGFVTLTAGSPGGVFRSTDGGVHWQLEFAGLPLTDTLSQIVAAGYDTWFAVSYGNVWRSTDGGLSWAAVNAGLDLFGVELFVFDGTAYAIGRNGSVNELHRYSDALNEWVLIPTPESIGAVLVEGSLIVAPNEMAYSPRVMRSTDGGQNWTIYEDAGFPVLGFTDLARVGTAIVALSPNDGVWHSLDDGATWEQIATSTDLSANLMRKLGADLYALNYSGQLFRSIDGGASWTPLNNGVASIRAVALDDSRLLIAADRVYRSDNDGASWTLSADGIIATSIASFQPMGAELAAVEIGRTGLHDSQDGGQTWAYDPATVPAGVEVTSVFAYDAYTILLGTRYHGIYRSTNGGQTWAAANAGWPTYYSDTFSTSYHRPIGFARIGNDLFVAGGGSLEVVGGTIGQPYRQSSGAGVYRSTNQGQSWQAVRSGIPITQTNPLHGNAMYASGVLFAQMGGTLLLSLDGYGIYRSTNQGASWQSANAGLPLYQSKVWLRASAFRDAGDVLLVADRAVNPADPQPALYASYDGGASWTPWSTGPGQQQGISDLVPVGGRLIAAVAPAYQQPELPTFFESSDDGQTWEALTQNVPGLSVNDLWTDGTSILAATRLGVWRLASSVVGDMNCDGQLDFSDINPFVALMTAPETYAAQHPTCDATLADLNNDGVVGFGDINAFVAALLGE